MSGRRRTRAGEGEDLFSFRPGVFLAEQLAAMQWPEASRFPVNHGGAKVRDTVWRDLVDSPSPLLVAGFSSIGELVDLLAHWGSQQPQGRARIVLGAEPFASQRRSFGSPEAVFTDEVRDYWLSEGVSLRLSAKLLQVRDLLAAGRVRVRFVDGKWRLHAKVYVGEAAATIGSSNFTGAGLGGQVEANVRSRATAQRSDYQGAAAIAENCWQAGQPWDEQFAALLHDMLRVVPWQEALARACAALLTGEWAQQHMPGQKERQQLWPTQIDGIAQALWVIDNVGSVLVSDATGSGKTRMGAHLVRSVHDRLVRSGRIRSGYATLVSPPGVQPTWQQEADDCDLALRVVSHGQLSRGSHSAEAAVRRAQILALDESHNFLNRASARTRRVVENSADHVLLFTATPISRGAQDLLSMVRLLGPDNFDDDTVDALLELERRPGRGLDPVLSQRLRRELGRFSVRRTKLMLNQAVDADPEAFTDPATGRVSRYPHQNTVVYRTEESADDARTAGQIRAARDCLHGLAYLGSLIERPVGTRSDDAALEARLRSAQGLARYRVGEAMRSSRAALIEHVDGTAAAVAHEGIGSAAKDTDSGDIHGKVARLMDGPPPEVNLGCPLPEWLTDPAAWRAACEGELAAYDRISRLARQLSTRREQGKAELLARLQQQDPRIIAFDPHPITLAVIRSLLQQSGARNVLLATGSTTTAKKRVTDALGRTAQEPALALCSDALNEGLNLQGASVIVHLDIPTTVRAAEQRVGRIERMDSPHEQITSHWPQDGPAFATRAAELLYARANTTRELLGSNLSLPELREADSHGDRALDVTEHIQRLQAAPAADWDGITDALEPVRELIQGPTAIVPAHVYRDSLTVQQRVLSRVSPVRARTPWAFFAVAGTQNGAPRWILLEQSPRPALHHLDQVTGRLRELLADDPPPAPLDGTSDTVLQAFLQQAATLESSLLPRKLQQALQQMATTTHDWRLAALGRGDHTSADRWQALHQAAEGTADPQPDPYLLAQRWCDLVQPRLDQQHTHHRRGLPRLRDITPSLTTTPLDLDQVEDALSRLPTVPPLDTRISACILGVPTPGLDSSGISR